MALDDLQASAGSEIADGSCNCFGAPPSTSDQSTFAPTDGGVLRVRVTNMDCMAEVAEIRSALERVKRIRQLQFNLPARELTIGADHADLPVALAAIRRAGFKAEPIGSVVEPSGAQQPVKPGFWPSQGRLFGALGLACAAEGVAFSMPGDGAAHLVGMAMAAASIAMAGLSVYGKGLAALRQGRLNISALMAVAVSGAFIIGQWPEASMVMTLYAIAETIEAHAVRRASISIRSLLALSPERAEVQQDDGSWERVPISEVAVGARVRIWPGERIPLDGVVSSGQSAIDQSPVTGESLPVDKFPGDDAYAGTINQTSALELRVTAPASDSTLTRIIHAVEEAQASRAPTQLIVDRFAAIYTPTVFATAISIVLLAPWLLGWSWIGALYKALVLLVIACPCALVISTPVTVVSGLAAAARRGILIKGGVYLEEARKIEVVAMDKTGTITEGHPTLVDFEPLDCGEKRETLEILARSLAVRSDHPVSKAVAEGVRAVSRDVVDFSAVPGRGIQGTIDDRTYVLGNHRWIEERGQCTDQLEARLGTHEEAGYTIAVLADSRRVLAICTVADTIKPSSSRAVAELKTLGVRSVMLTGDNLAVGQSIAAQAGIDEVRGDLLPDEKLQAISELQRRFGVTAMVGDGINDAPALARANLGFAMGAAGTHIAMEAADVLVMNDDLCRLPETIRLSRRTHSVLWQNILFALGIKFMFIGFAVFGNASMWMAVFADMGASLLVVFNGLRLLDATSLLGPR